MKMILASQNKRKLMGIERIKRDFGINHMANALVIFREFLKVEEDTAK